MKKILFLFTLLILSAVTLSAEQPEILSDLQVKFGYTGTPYALHLYDNPTATAIARHVGRRDWQLPIVGFEGFENSDVMHYYDIPSHYVVPSAATKVTSEKAGEVYYSYPNRLILFYHDAEVKGEYTRVGYFDATADFIKEVEENPVLEVYGVMIISVKK